MCYANRFAVMRCTLFYINYKYTIRFILILNQENLVHNAGKLFGGVNRLQIS